MSLLPNIFAQPSPLQTSVANAGGSVSLPTPLAQFKFNGDFLDASGNGNNGGGVNSPTFTTGQDSVAIHAVNLDGTTQFVTVGTVGNFAAFTSQDFSVSFWINVTSLANSPIAFSVGAGYLVNGYYCQFGAGGNIYISYNIGSQTGNFDSGASKVVTGTWQHITITRTGVSIKIYVNGADTSATGAWQDPATSNTNRFCIGAYSEGASGFDFPGAIDDFRVYTACLSAAQVAAIYAGGAQ